MLDIYVHDSVRPKLKIQPKNMDKVFLETEHSKALSDIAASVFEDCSKSGMSFNDVLLSIYLTGMDHGLNAKRDLTKSC